MTAERYPSIALYLDGEWIEENRRTLEVEDPATRQIIGTVPVAEIADVDRAVTAAAAAFPAWRAISPHRRADLLIKAAGLLRERSAEIATAMTLENGKPFRDSIDEVEYSADIMESMAGEGSRRFGQVLPTASADGRTLLVEEPIGPVAAFTTWNYPLTVPARKVAAALAAGCTVVIKPAEETPASAIALARALDDAGLPHGVLNMLFGDPDAISRQLIAAPEIRMISFTGSTAVGKLLARTAADEVKPITLELGGHAPVLIFDDVDVDAVVADALGAKLHNAGQSCGSPIRFLVHENIHDQFVERFATALDSATIGDPFDPAMDMGPLSNTRRFAAMQPLIDDAVRRGARLVAGGRGDDSTGYYWRPTLLAGVSDDAELMRTEPFGPIAVTATFTDESEAVQRANDVAFGLAAYVFTGSADRALRLPAQLDAGMVTVNRFGVGARDTFFGGRKQSGYGSDGGPQAVGDYMVHKLITQGVTAR